MRVAQQLQRRVASEGGALRPHVADVIVTARRLRQDEKGEWAQQATVHAAAGGVRACAYVAVTGIGRIEMAAEGGKTGGGRVEGLEAEEGSHNKKGGRTRGAPQAPLGPSHTSRPSPPLGGKQIGDALRDQKVRGLVLREGTGQAAQAPPIEL